MKLKYLNLMNNILIFTLVISIIGIIPYMTYNLLKVFGLLLLGIILIIYFIIIYKHIEIDNKDKLLFIFLTLTFISTIFSTNILKSFFGSANRYEGFIMFSVYAIIYLYTKKLFNKDNIQNFIKIIFYLSVLCGIVGILQRHIDIPGTYPIFHKIFLYYGVSSTFGNPNYFGSFISLILPATIIIFIIKGNVKSYILTLLMFFNLLSCCTRSAWVAYLLISFIIFIWLLKEKKKEYFKNFGILLISFVLIFIYLFYGFNTNGESDFRDKFYITIKDIKKTSQIGINNDTGSGRIELWKLTFNVIKKHPLIGCGIDNLYLLANRFVADKAHNEYLQIAATSGIPNLIVYLLFLWNVLKFKIKNIREKKSFFWFCIIFSYLIQAFFNISTIGITPLFYAILGLSDNKNLSKIKSPLGL